ncbi:hypothetical protein [Vibrio sp. C8]
MNTVVKVLLGLVGGVIAFFLIVIFAVSPLVKWYSDNKPPIGSSKYDHYIRIQGLKPEDASIKAYATFYGGGEDCQSFFLSASDGKKRQGGKGVFEIKHNFSEVPTQYELRIPYQNYQSSGCAMKLSRITVEAYNAFDKVGFAQLRIYQAGNDYDDKAISLSSKIESKSCDAYIFKGLGNVWSGSIGCYLFVNEKKISKVPNYNAETLYFDFSQFGDDTVIHYDIIAGKDYRNEPLEPKTGK